MGIRAKYLDLSNAVFHGKIKEARWAQDSCCLCAHQCGVNRNKGERGFCGGGKNAEVAYWQIHRGEEPPLAELGGAGAVFFAYCNMKCVYCFEQGVQSNIKNFCLQG